MIVKSEAIVLKSIKYGDTSKIITLFTKDFGKISVIAKGSRKPKNKFGSSLNPLSYINVNFYFKQNRDLQILNNSEIIKNFANIDTNYNSLVATLTLAEFINYITETNEINIEIFNLLLKSIKIINDYVTKAYTFILKALIDLSAISGFATNFKFLEKNFDNIVFSLEDGKPILALPQNLNFVKISFKNLKILYELQLANSELQLLELIIDKKMFIECINFFQKYFNFHLDKNFKLRTLNLLQQL